MEIRVRERTTELLQINKALLAEISERKQAEETLRKSEELLTKLIATIPDIVVRTDTNGQILFVNEAGPKMGGYARAEIIGNNLLSYIVPEDRKRAFKNMMLMFEQKIPPIEYHLLRKDGRKLLFEVNGNILRNEDGPPYGFVFICRDITERRLAEEALRESENKYRDMANSLPQIIFETDVKGNFTFVNRAAFALSGYTQEDFAKGVNALTTIIPEERDRARSNIQRILAGEENTSNEYIFLRKDGSTYPVIIHSNAITRDNQTVGMRGFVIDITERKRAEEERENLILELRDALSKIKTLSGMLPICSSCKKIRDDKGYWNQIESYIKSHSEAEFSHGICPECAKIMYPYLYKKMYPEDDI